MKRLNFVQYHYSLITFCTEILSYRTTTVHDILFHSVIPHQNIVSIQPFYYSKNHGVTINRVKFLLMPGCVYAK